MKKILTKRMIYSIIVPNMINCIRKFCILTGKWSFLFFKVR